MKIETPIDSRNTTNSWYYALISLLMIVLFSATFYIWNGLKKKIATESHELFVRDTQKASDAVLQRMLHYESALVGGRALFAGGGEISREKWHDYVKSLQLSKKLPGIQGMGYSIVLTPEQLAPFEQQTRNQGFPDFKVRPPGDRAVYTSIIYLEPLDQRNLRAFGFDMYSEAIRRAAMDGARDSGEPTLSGKVKLVQENDDKVQAGILLYVPVYRHSADIEFLEQRREELIGYVYSPFRMNDLMEGILSGENLQLDMEIFDGTEMSQKTELFDFDEARITHPLYSHTRQLQISGRTWTLNFKTTPSFEKNIDHTSPSVVLVSGILTSSLLLGVLLLLLSGRTRALRLADRITYNLRKSEKRYEQVIEATNDGIWEWDIRSGHTYFSTRFIQMLGYTKDELPAVYQSVERLLHPDDRALLKQKLLAHFKHGEKYDLELRFASKSAGYRYFQIKGQASFDGNGKAIEMVGSISDITERKEIANALTISEDKFRRLIEFAPIGLFLLNGDGICTYSNNSLRKLFDDNFKLIGLDWLQCIHPDDLKAVREAWQQAISGGNGFQQEFRVIQETGVMWISGTIVRFSEQESSQDRYIGTMFDMTSRVKLEQLKSEFISTVSHELRTPLTSVKGALGLVVGGVFGTMPEKMHGLMVTALHNCQTLNNLINDILDMEKLASGKFRLHLESQDIGQLLQQAIEANMSYAAQLHVGLELYSELPKTLINIDKGRIEQVLNNLISNAAKFSPKNSKVRVSLLLKPGFVRIEVKDDGIGISEEFRSRIFQKFAQADSSDTRVKGGTGLGLHISKALIECHGGSIGFDSKPGQGSVFFFELPLD